MAARHGIAFLGFKYAFFGVAKNYEMIQGARLSNSFILLMVLNEAKEPLLRYLNLRIMT